MNRITRKPAKVSPKKKALIQDYELATAIAQVCSHAYRLSWVEHQYPDSPNAKDLYRLVDCLNAIREEADDICDRATSQMIDGGQS